MNLREVILNTNSGGKKMVNPKDVLDKLGLLNSEGSVDFEALGRFNEEHPDLFDEVKRLIIEDFILSTPPGSQDLLRAQQSMTDQILEGKDQMERLETLMGWIGQKLPSLKQGLEDLIMFRDKLNE